MGKKRFYDITIPIESGMISWPGDGPVNVERVRSMDDGDRLNQSRIDMSAHTGTHMDAPIHFIQNGEGIDSTALDLLVGPVVVIQIPNVMEIGASQLESSVIPVGTERLLLKTDNAKLLGKREFDQGYTYITLDGARYLIDHGVRLVGIDYLSVAEYGKGEVVHRELLGAGIVIIEGLDLREVLPGIYNMTALPLRISDCDGAPARVVLEG
jgi:arylformamidase